MFCAQCQNTLTECVCDDLEERLSKLADHPNFITDRCSECYEHPQNCYCDEPTTL